LQSHITQSVEQLANVCNPDFTTRRRDDLQRNIEPDDWPRLEVLFAPGATRYPAAADDVRDCEASRIIHFR
jgi:hypothetical protein